MSSVASGGVRLSYVHGASNVQLLGSTIGDLFDQTADRFPDNMALVSRHQNIRFTYRQLKEECDRFARSLMAIGVAKGDRVGIWSPNNYEWVIVQFATAKIGAILVNINPAYRVSFQSEPADPVEKRVCTVGQVHPHVECKIIDPDTGATVPRGTTGELLSRGYIVMLGYWNNIEATAASIDSAQWMHTGDLAVMEEDGFVRIVGRSKDMSEEVMAWVILKPDQNATEQDLGDFCTGKISHFKVPRYWRFTDSFPMTVSGKIQKYKMREIAKQELGLK